MNPTVHLAGHQLRLFQDADVAGDGGQRDGEWLGQLGDGRRSLCQPGQERASGAIAQGAEEPVELAIVGGGDPGG